MTHKDALETVNAAMAALLAGDEVGCRMLLKNVPLEGQAKMLGILLGFASAMFSDVYGDDALDIWLSTSAG